MTTQPLLTADEVAAQLRLSTPQVYQLARTKRLASIRFGARAVRFHPDAVAEYIEQHTVPARNP